MNYRSLILTMFVCVLVFTFPVAPSRSVTISDSGFQQDKPASGTQPSLDEVQARYKAHQGDFDYLLGDWEFTGSNRQGKFFGYWSAVRLPETGQIMDEFRILNDNGGTIVVSTTLRAYNAVLDQWELVLLDNRRTGLQNFGTGHREGAEMRIEQKFGIGICEYCSMSRIRYYNIQPDRFSWNADKSYDGGKTWIKDFQQIEARRIGPPRSLSPLTTANKARAGER